MIARTEHLDWEAEGYFTPSRYAPTEPDTPHGGDPASRLRDALLDAKRGNFSRVRATAEALGPALDPALWELACTVIGDAGPDGCFRAVRKAIQTDDELDLTIELCEALAARGSLSDIPLLLSAYVGNAELRDASVIPTYISMIMGDDIVAPEHPSEVPAYRRLTLEYYHALAAQHGSTDVLLCRGKLLSAENLAYLLLADLEAPLCFLPFWRRRFEATTGIDCSSFYHERRLQPLTAAAIIERFLESDRVARFLPGVRYFFGHRIPA